MKLIPWSKSENRPAVFAGDMDRDIDSLFDAFFGAGRAFASVADWTPSLDVKESKDEVTVHADLPGLKKDEILIDVENGVLSISGERQSEESKEGDGWHRVERSYGSFRRSVALPKGVDESKVKAEYKDGVLKVSLPKTEAARPRTIRID